MEIPVKDISLTNGKAELTKDIVFIEKWTRIENIREFIPDVIEPSFELAVFRTH